MAAFSKAKTLISRDLVTFVLTSPMISFIRKTNVNIFVLAQTVTGTRRKSSDGFLRSKKQQIFRIYEPTQILKS